MSRIINAAEVAQICAKFLSVDIPDGCREIKYDTSTITCIDRNCTVIVKSSVMNKRQTLYSDKTTTTNARIFLRQFIVDHIDAYEDRINDEELSYRIRKMKTAMANITGKKYKSRYSPKTHTLKVYQLLSGSRQFMINVNLVTGDKSATIADIKLFRFYTSTEFDSIDGVCDRVKQYMDGITEDIKIVHSIIEEHLMSDAYSLAMRKYYRDNVVITAPSSSTTDSSM